MPAAPFARAPSWRWPIASAFARWFVRGRFGAGAGTGSDTAVISCARRLGSVGCVRAWRRWCTPPTCAARCVELAPAAATVGFRVDPPAAGAALALDVTSSAANNVPASTYEAVRIRVRGLT
ncbi:MAG TPA: hypothetical protein VN896_06295 [Methylomirabilota bacterium]|nr:hypothetical protein [Methylomirabilota bacterium]